MNKYFLSKLTEAVLCKNGAVFILREKVEKIKVYDDSSIENMYEREKRDKFYKA